MVSLILSFDTIKDSIKYYYIQITRQRNIPNILYFPFQCNPYLNLAFVMYRRYFSGEKRKLHPCRRFGAAVDLTIRHITVGDLAYSFNRILSSCFRKQNIETAKQLLSEEAKTKKEEALEDGTRVWEKQDTVWNEIKELIKNYRQPNCPACKKGRLHFAGIVKDVPREPG